MKFVQRMTTGVNRSHRVTCIVLLIACLLGILPFTATVFAAEPGDGTSVGQEHPQGITPQSTINGMQISFSQEYGKTSIWLRICAGGPNFQLRSELVGGWLSELFLRTQASGGCSPSTI